MMSLRLKHSKPQPITIKATDIASEHDATPSPPSGSSPSSQKSDDIVRVVFLGSSKVGKTSIIERFLYNRFEPKHIPTVEEMHSKKFVVGNNLVRLTLVDTAGSFDFPVMLRLCISKASAFVLVFANDDADSLAQAGYLLNQIKLQRKDYAPLSSAAPGHSADPGDSLFSPALVPPSPPITVVCNKSDLSPADSQISEGVIMEWLLSNGLKPSQFVYSSAKTNDSVLAIFKSLWAQNEVTQAVTFGRWDGVHRPSLGSAQPRTPPINIGNDFSALNDAVSPCDSNISPDSTKSEKHGSKSRSGFFHSSLRLNRRSSSKSSKYQSDVVKLDCVIS
ncbi:unnamed protein product [Calicophoron daubneyi]|uniref:GTP-binding protein Rhes n=1 Tax=Calicophoron daubneyi TaxID=300641 RepID=A0AAV2T2G3_CALDB